MKKKLSEMEMVAIVALVGVLVSLVAHWVDRDPFDEMVLPKAPPETEGEVTHFVCVALTWCLNAIVKENREA